MRVSFNNIGQNNFLQIYSLNRSGAMRNRSREAVQSGKSEDGDTVTISIQGRKQNLIEDLIKLKVHITEQKTALIGNTLEKGGKLESIKYQLEAYDEQIKNIDGQIRELMAQEIEKQAEKMKPSGDKKPKTKQELHNERLASISSLSGDLQQAKTIHSAKTSIDGDSRILASEIKLDKAYAALSNGYLKAKVAHKEAELADMEQQALRLNSKMAEKLADISEKAATDNEKAAVEVPHENSKES